MSNEIDLESDAEWLELVASFRTHFWQVRVPELLSNWAAAKSVSQAQWPDDLKRAIHGIAGSAGLIGYADIGDAARSVEQAWDRGQLSAEALMQRIDALAQHIAKLASEQT